MESRKKRAIVNSSIHLEIKTADGSSPHGSIGGRERTEPDPLTKIIHIYNAKKCK
jgi:hypothetical protein